MLVRGKVISGTPKKIRLQTMKLTVESRPALWYNLTKTWRYLPDLCMNKDDLLEVFDRLKAETHD